MMLARHGIVAVATTATLVFSLAATAGASTADQDPEFSGDGIVTTPIGLNHQASANAVAIQLDGKLVTAGNAFSGGEIDFALARYDTDGSLDPTFSSDGKLLTPVGIPGGHAFAHAMGVQGDGKIVAAGRASSASGYEFALARNNPDGVLDPGFSEDGKVTTPIAASPVGSRMDVAHALAIQADGKIVAAGSSYSTDSYNDFALARYNTDGSLDPSFSGDGIVATAIWPQSADTAYAVAVQADGKLLAAGSSSLGFSLARYDSDGSLDPSFSGDGIVTTEIARLDEAYAVAIQVDGKIVAAGRSFSTSGGEYEMALARYETDGSLDPSFSDDGIVTTQFGAGEDAAQGIAVQADGKIVVAGRSVTVSGGEQDFALVRYDIDGSLDQGFSTDGKILTPLGQFARAYGVVVQADGKVVAAGTSDGDFALVRYVPSRHFEDVPAAYWAFDAVESLATSKITAGCQASPPMFCPEHSITRAHMAALLINAMGEEGNLPSYRGYFSDVSAGQWYAGYVERLYQLGVTAGCGSGRYCPAAPVTRGQMAVFLLRAIGHASHLPTYRGLFSDVPVSNPYARFIEHLYDHSITAGCATGPLRYCPGSSVTRAQMSVFLVRAFGL